MKIQFHNKTVWNLPQIAQYESYEYSPGLCCPDCSLNGWYRWIDENKYDIIGCAEVNGEMQVCCECHHCGKKYRYHLSKSWDSNGNFDVEKWQDDVALLFFLNRETYKKFEVEEGKIWD